MVAACSELQQPKALSWVEKHCRNTRWSILSSPLSHTMIKIPCLIFTIAAYHLCGGRKNDLVALRKIMSQAPESAERIPVTSLVCLINGMDMVLQYRNTPLQPLVRTVNRLKEARTLMDLGQGMCAGITLCFNHYAAQKERSKENLIALAEHFILGAPDEIEPFNERGLDIFNSLGSFLTHSKGHMLQLIPSATNRENLSYVNADDLQTLSPSIYNVRMCIDAAKSMSPFHAISLIKISNEEIFIFDPAKGLFHFKGPIQETFTHYILTVYRYTHSKIWQDYLYSRSIEEKRIIDASMISEFYLQISPHSPTDEDPQFPFEPIRCIELKPERGCGAMMMREVVCQMKAAAMDWRCFSKK